MARITKYLLISFLCATMFVCIGLLAACNSGNDPAQDGESVTVTAKLVFDDARDGEFTKENAAFTFSTDIEKGRNVPASITVNDGETPVTYSGFTLSANGGKYTLSDKNNNLYAVELVKDGSSYTASTIHGQFIKTGEMEDFDNNEEGSRHYADVGYFGVGDLDASGELGWLYLQDLYTDGHMFNNYMNFDDMFLTTLPDSGDLYCLTSGDENNIYAVYFHFEEKGGNKSILVTEIQQFSLETGVIYSFQDEVDGNLKLAKGLRLYASPSLEYAEGDTVFALLKDYATQGGDTYVRYMSCDVLLGDYQSGWICYGEVLEDNYFGGYSFDFDQNGDVIPGSEKFEYYDAIDSEDGKWRFGFLWHPDPEDEEEIIIDHIVDFGPIDNGEYTALPIITTKNEDGSFDVLSFGEEWKVSVELVDTENWQFKLNVTTFNEVEIAGKAVLFTNADGSEDAVDISLKIEPVNGSADGAHAMLIYYNEENIQIMQTDFTLEANGGEYLLCDGYGLNYRTVLVWNQPSQENSVKIYADFVPMEAIKDYENAANSIEYGYLGISGVPIRQNYYRLTFGEVLVDGEPLVTYVDDLNKCFISKHPIYGDLYGVAMDSADGQYFESFYITQKGETPALLVASIDYFPTDGTTFGNFEYSDNYTLSLKQGTVLYSSKIFGLSAYEPTYAPVFTPTADGQKIITPVLGVYHLPGEDLMHESIVYLHMDNSAVWAEVTYGGDGTISAVTEMKAGKLYSVTPNLQSSNKWDITVLLTEDGEHNLQADELITFGYLYNGVVYYPDCTVEKEDDGSFTVHSADGEWKVKVAVNGDDISVSVEEVTVDYSLKYNWAYCENGQTDKQADVFFIAPSAVMGKQGQEILDFTRESARRNFVGAIDMEKGIYDTNARFFAPYYRQAVLYDYTLEEAEREEYISYAYEDVKAAFTYYLENWNNGRPIVLAGFSQGADHCIRLLKDVFYTTPELYVEK